MTLTTTAVTSADGSTRAEFVPAANMVCCSLKVGAAEHLSPRKGLDAYASQGSTMGIPLLYPWANRLGARDFELAGRRLTLPHDPARIHQDGDGTPLHGLIPSLMRWRAEGNEHRLTAELAWTAPELLALFPFPHELRLEMEVEAGSLTVTTTVRASQGGPVPVSFGFHPYIMLIGAPRAQWTVQLPRCAQLALDARMLPTGRRMPVTGGPVSLAEHGFDDAYALADAASIFLARAGERRITVELLEGFAFAQVFSPPGSDFICFEPMTAPCNALVDGDGLIVLASGEQHRTRHRVTISG